MRRIEPCRSRFDFPNGRIRNEQYAEGDPAAEEKLRKGIRKTAKKEEAKHGTAPAPRRRPEPSLPGRIPSSRENCRCRTVPHHSTPSFRIGRDRRRFCRRHRPGPVRPRLRLRSKRRNRHRPERSRHPAQDRMRVPFRKARRPGSARPATGQAARPQRGKTGGMVLPAQSWGQDRGCGKDDKAEFRPSEKLFGFCRIR